MTVASQSLLFAPARFREVTLRNHIMLSPMCTYSANEGMASDWHVVHLGQFALGGFGAVFVEATAVTEQGRITYGDIRLWSNEADFRLKDPRSFRWTVSTKAGDQRPR